ncbi:hypothetical protein [Ruegeria sp. HKCCD8929]|uniref:hypothetical protein n=1 Tax=Ruegeria sp. HKCCD8929 TaxID=2683006 RepID=UPI0014887606|nr:hypothetical protein [Ruegeria sp. HKCCD8929]
MSWRTRTLIGLGGLLIAQAMFAAGLVLGREQGGNMSVVTFDPELSLTTFVIWSNTRLETEEFTSVLPAFQEQVATVLQAYAAENGVMVVRKDGVLSQHADVPADVTDAVMREVLSGSLPGSNETPFAASRFQREREGSPTFTSEPGE